LILGAAPTAVRFVSKRGANLLVRLLLDAIQLRLSRHGVGIAGWPVIGQRTALNRELLFGQHSLQAIEHVGRVMLQALEKPAVRLLDVESRAGRFSSASGSGVCGSRSFFRGGAASGVVVTAVCREAEAAGDAGVGDDAALVFAGWPDIAI
jgi:hypothetical protein